MPQFESIEEKTLASLPPAEKAHWELHLNAVMKDSPALKGDVRLLLDGAVLPNIKYPAYIHDWMEIPNEREKIEALNG